MSSRVRSKHEPSVQTPQLLHTLGIHRFRTSLRPDVTAPGEFAKYQVSTFTFDPTVTFAPQLGIINGITVRPAKTQISLGIRSISVFDVRFKGS